MKINRNTSIACIVAIILSGICVAILGCFAPQTTGYNTIQNIMLGIFSSSIVSFVISFVGYFHERSIIIEATKNNVKSLYINLCVLSKITGDTLQQIHTAVDLSILPFSNISGLSALNVDFLNGMNLGLFHITYNIKNISMNLQAQALEYSNQYLKMRNDEMYGMQISPIMMQNLDALKNVINIKTAKFHEYTTGKSLELEKIIKAFYEHIGDKQSWEDIKASLLMQIEEIVKG